MKHFFLAFFLIGFSVKVTAQDPAATDFKHLEAAVHIESKKGKISGDLIFTFDVLEPTDSIFINAQKMDFKDIFLNGKEIRSRNDGEKLWLLHDFQPERDQKLEFSYSANPQQAMYFVSTQPKIKTEEFQVWTQGQGKYTSHWLPSFDDTTEKLEFDLSVTYPKDKTVIANGKLLETVAVNDSLLRWKFDMKNPMSSYLLAIAAGNFEKEEKVAKNGISLQHFYPRGKEKLVEPTYRHTGEIMDFLETETGIDYPWQNYKQVPVRDFLYAGMENTGTTIFSDIFLVDSTGFKDRNYVSVNAHEMAHQWFGNLVTAASGEHHWLQEGFATYYALLAEKAIFGEDYFYWKLFKSADELKQMSDSGKGESLLNPKASSLTFYQKGAWALHILKGIVGKEAFDLGVKNYLAKYKYGNVTTADFIAEMESASGQDLDQFMKDWVRQSAFQGTAALEALKKSPFINKYMEVAALKPQPINEKRQLLKNALRFPVNDYVGQEVVYQLALEDVSEVSDLYKKAFETNNLYVRQAIAVSLQQIPEELKSHYESLLEDDSYVTKEAALYNLWMNFPEEQAEYLEKMSGIDGFIDKNIRTLWLALNLATPEVSATKKREYFGELSSYTAPYHRFQVRQNAFGYLFQLEAFDGESLYNLVEATRHHNYRFKGYAKGLLNTLLDSGGLEPAEKTLIEERLETETAN